MTSRKIYGLLPPLLHKILMCSFRYRTSLTSWWDFRLLLLLLLLLMMMQAVSASEAFANFYETTWRNILENSNRLHPLPFSRMVVRLFNEAVSTVLAISRRIRWNSKNDHNDLLDEGGRDHNDLLDEGGRKLFQSRFTHRSWPLHPAARYGQRCPGREGVPSPLVSAQIKNAWSFVATPPTSSNRMVLSHLTFRLVKLK
jgi:hypothetical protein